MSNNTATKLISSLMAFALASFLILTQWQCSNQSSDDNSSASNPNIPGDWDGTSDWGSSKYTVSDL